MKTTAFTFLLKDSLREFLAVEAKKQGRSIANLINYIISEYKHQKER